MRWTRGSEGDEEEQDRRWSRRWIRRGAVGAAMIVALSCPGWIGAQEPGRLSLRDSVFISAAGDSVPAEFGTLTVPARWEGTGGDSIDLAFFRFPSTASDPGPPVVYLAGGPGGSGIASAREDRFPLFTSLRRAGDVIALDQRGTGASQPGLVCPEPISHPLPAPKTRAALLQSIREWSRGCVSHFRNRGIDLAAYHTEAIADDIEALRRALGAPRLDLWGISYGTHLALSVLRRHPESVRRAVLAGVEGPDHTLKLPSSIQSLLERVDSLSRRPEMWPEGAGPLEDGFLRTLDAALDLLDEEPAYVPLPRGDGDTASVRLDRFVVEWLIAGSVGDSETLSRLPLLAGALARGKFELLAPIVVGALDRRARAMTFTTDCASGASPGRIRRIAAEAETTLVGDAGNFPFPDVCEAWPHEELGSDFREPVRSSVPTLFISGTLDGRTPPSNAREVARGFSRSHHLVLEGASHDDDLFLSSPRIGKIVLRFLRGEAPATTHLPVDFRFSAPGGGG